MGTRLILAACIYFTLKVNTVILQKSYTANFDHEFVCVLWELHHYLSSNLFLCLIQYATLYLSAQATLYIIVLFPGLSHFPFV